MSCEYKLFGDNTSGLPTKISCFFARVMATFSLLSITFSFSKNEFSVKNFN